MKGPRIPMYIAMYAGMVLILLSVYHNIHHQPAFYDIGCAIFWALMAILAAIHDKQPPTEL